MQKHENQWPDHFNFITDDVCQNTFKPFILSQLGKLKVLDGQRPPDTKYIFHEHAERVAQDVKKTCLHMELGAVVAENMYWATLPHDIGKTALPAEIWDSTEKPSAELKALRRSHTRLGAEILDGALAHVSDHPFMTLMRDIMLYHHEEMGGGGTYGMRGEELSMPVRLASIVEAFDGWSIPRPHFNDRDTSPAAVIQRMRDEKMHMFDKDLFEKFAEIKEI